MKNFEAWSDDGKYGVRIVGTEFAAMQRLCREADTVETGGILVGYYNRNQDCAIVTRCCKPPSDSKCAKHKFYRGVMGLRELLLRLWNARRRRYYLGEWHYHHYGAPNPSGDDTVQMRRNSENAKCQCPEPILVIIGGDPNGDTKCRAFVYEKKKGLVELIKGWEKQVSK